MLKRNTWVQKKKTREVLSNNFEGPTGWFTWLCCSISRVPVLPQKNRIAHKTVPSFLSLSLSTSLSLSMSHTKFLTYICHTDTFSWLFMLRFSTCDSPQAGCLVCQESLDQTPQRICVNVNTSGFLASVSLRFWSNIDAFTVMFSLALKPDKCVEVSEESFWRHLLYSSLNANRCGHEETHSRLTVATPWFAFGGLN